MSKQSARPATPIVLGVVLVAFAAGAVSVPALFAQGASPAKDVQVVDPATAQEGDRVTIEGRLRLVGTALFAQFVVQAADGEQWYLDGDYRRLLADLEHKEVKVRGTLSFHRLILADGRDLGTRRELSDIELLN